MFTSTASTVVVIRLPPLSNQIKDKLCRDERLISRLRDLAVAHALRYNDKDGFNNRPILNKELATQIGIILRDYPNLKEETQYLVRVKRSIGNEPCLDEVSGMLLDSYRISHDGRDLILRYK